MANSLFSQFNNQNQNQLGALIQQAHQLRQNLTANPRLIVEQMMRSGAISQADFNRVAPLAQQIAAMMPKHN